MPRLACFGVKALASPLTITMSMTLIIIVITTTTTATTTIITTIITIIISITGMLLRNANRVTIMGMSSNSCGFPNIVTLKLSSLTATQIMKGLGSRV